MPSTERKKSKFSNSFFTHTKHHPVYLTRIESQVCCLHSRTNVQHILSTCYFFFHFIYLFLQIPMYAQCVHQVDKHINVYIICAKLSHFCNKNPVIYKNKYIFPLSLSWIHFSLDRMECARTNKWAHAIQIKHTQKKTPEEIVTWKNCASKGKKDMTLTERTKST